MNLARFSHVGPEGSEGNRILLLQHLGSTWASAGWEAKLKKREALHLMLLLVSGSLVSRERKSCLLHRSDSVVPKLKPENSAPLLDANIAFTEANVGCRDATVIKGRRKRITPFWRWSRALGHSLWDNVWRIFLLGDDKTMPKWLCSYLKHPNVWEIQSEACSCYFIFSLGGKSIGWVG